MRPKYRILPIGGGGITPSGSLTITENGVYDVTHYEDKMWNQKYIVPFTLTCTQITEP